MQPGTTRRRLLEATAAMIAEEGWGAVSTRTVADRAAVNPGVVHYHFESIDELRRTAVLEAIESLIRELEPAMREMSPRAFIDTSLTMAAELGATSTMSLLMYEALPAAARDPLLRERLAPWLERFRTGFAERIRTWHPSPAADPVILAEIVGALLDGLQIHLMAMPDLDLAAHVEPLLQLLGPEEEPT